MPCMTNTTWDRFIVDYFLINQPLIVVVVSLIRGGEDKNASCFPFFPLFFFLFFFKRVISLGFNLENRGIVELLD